MKKLLTIVTETEYRALQQMLSEAAEFEALKSKEETIKGFNESLKANTEAIKKEEPK